MANKTSSKKTNLIDFSNSAEAIKKTATSVNEQMKEVVNEVASDLKTNGENLSEKTLTPVKEVYEMATENLTLENMMNVAKSANDYTVKTAGELIDGVVENAGKWQKIAEKAINGGLEIANKQQEMVLDTLETVNGQFSDSAKRLKKLLYN
ncbi:MAG: hypothetical protein AAFR61_22165 [Bacteroidota bacterium]